ncbi:MAG: SDR family oxidoreductase [Rhodanobacter sp.]|nr:MAG: SDR family oxidoreductase [Rhodanobacter sp.]
MNYELTSKVVLIVGGTTGIGLATARAFALQGTKVVVASRNKDHGAAAVSSLVALGSDACFIECDVGKAASVDNLLSSVLRQFGRLDCAVNSVGYDLRLARAHEMAPREVSEQLSVDVEGVFSCMRVEIDAMLGKNSGTIVNVASTTGLSGTPKAALYSAGKHAVIGLTRSIAKEYIGDGIRINAVCPGPTATPRRERRVAHLSLKERTEQDSELAMEIPIGRLGSAQEIANAIIWLSSPLSSYVVGHSLVIDGGLTA